MVQWCPGAALPFFLVESNGPRVSRGRTFVFLVESNGPMLSRGRTFAISNIIIIIIIGAASVVPIRTNCDGLIDGCLITAGRRSK